MAHLFSLTVVQSGQTPFSPPSTILLNSRDVVRADAGPYTNAAGAVQQGTHVEVAWYDETFRQVFISSAAPSTVATAINAANTTDVSRMAFTKVNDDNSQQAFSCNVNQIKYVQKDTLNQWTMMLVEDPEQDLVASIRVTNSVASILSAANA